MSGQYEDGGVPEGNYDLDEQSIQRLKNLGYNVDLIS